MNLENDEFHKVEFQFPSNGKVDSEQKGLQNSWSLQRFNSLQTGKCIQSPILNWAPLERSKKVSIPFKRESGFRERGFKMSKELEFVSIPFKRESGFRVRRLF